MPRTENLTLRSSSENSFESNAHEIGNLSARSIYRMASSTQPENLDSIKNIAATLLEKTESHSALRKFFQRIKNAIFSPHLWKTNEQLLKLALRNLNGTNTPLALNDPREFLMLKKVAEKGHVEAQFYVGWGYENGYGVEQSSEEANKWFTMAAEQGHVEAQFFLAARYHKGDGVTQDQEAAVKWFTMAAEQGYAASQFFLGWSFDNGLGVEQNFSEAVKWYTMAANQGLAEAQSCLGVCYHKGLGVEIRTLAM